MYTCVMPQTCAVFCIQNTAQVYGLTHNVYTNHTCTEYAEYCTGLWLKTQYVYKLYIHRIRRIRTLHRSMVLHTICIQTIRTQKTQTTQNIQNRLNTQNTQNTQNRKIHRTTKICYTISGSTCRMRTDYTEKRIHGICNTMHYTLQYTRLQ